jgi:GAF domain-containing protein
MNDDKSNSSGAKHSGADALNDARLRAARKRLAESRDQEDAIDGLREIAATFLGSEEIGLFRVDHERARFQVMGSFGIDPEEYDLQQALGEPGLERLMRGECHVEFGARDRSGAAHKAQAFIPIRRANQTMAILAVLRLLPQKIAFDKSDMELFKLLSDEAAMPLFGGSGHSKPEIDESGIRA